jgi:hypothetical protein
MTVVSQIKLTANDRLDALFFGLLYKLEDPEHITVVSYSHSLLSVVLCLRHESRHFRSPVKQGVLGVVMQMAKVNHVSGGKNANIIQIFNLMSVMLSFVWIML